MSLDDPKDLCGGYECHFVGEIPHDLVCAICLLPARDPQQTTCDCGRIYCTVCLTTLRTISGRCPTCRQTLETFLDRASGRRVKALKVMCSYRDHACQWTGDLDSLEDHKTRCEYAEIQCINNCGQTLLRGTLDAHLSEHCPLRNYTCPHCQQVGKYREVTGDHVRECPDIRTDCPNPGCTFNSERKNIETHRMECPKEVVTCPSAKVGCSWMALREELERHNRESIDHHMDLITRMVRPLIEVAPVVLKMRDVSKHRKGWFSPPFYSHVHGYKFCFNVTTNRSQDDDGTLYLSVYLYLMRGENDDELVWPLRAKFIVTLLNQQKDSGHWSKVIEMDSFKSDDYNCRVADRERSTSGWGDREFYPYKRLTRRHFLKDDALYFKVEVKLRHTCKPWLIAIN